MSTVTGWVIVAMHLAVTVCALALVWLSRAHMRYTDRMLASHEKSQEIAQECMRWFRDAKREGWEVPAPVEEGEVDEGYRLTDEFEMEVERERAREEMRGG